MTISGVNKAFGAQEMLKNVNLAVDRGDAVTILGPSCSGKTMFLRCLNFPERANGGTFDLHAASRRDIARICRKTMFVLQSYNLFLNKTALGNIIEGLSSRGKYARARTARLCSKRSIGPSTSCARTAR